MTTSAQPARIRLVPNVDVGGLLGAAACWPKRLMLATPGDAEAPKPPGNGAPKLTACVAVEEAAGAAAAVDAAADAPNKPAWPFSRCSSDSRQKVILRKDSYEDRQGIYCSQAACKLHAINAIE